MFKSSNNLLRNRDTHAQVKFVELFFDLVFVFTIIQLSHSLSHHFDLHGALQSFVLMLAVWIVWIYTTWHLNWLDPDTVQVRIMLYVVMFAAMILSMAIPDAFGDKGIFFGAAFAFIQIGRTLFIVWATKDRLPVNHKSFVLILVWLIISGIFWLVGGLLDAHGRFLSWSAAVGIEFFAPMIGFWVPGIGKTGPRDWDISGAHMAERCGLFVIICLGESICVNGATLADLPWTATNLGVFTVSFALTVLMWWNYFHCGQYAGTHRIENSSNPGKIAMWAYHYAHIPIVMGIVLLAVACYLLFKHPVDLTDAKTAAAFIGSGTLFVSGCIIFKKIVSGKVPVSDISGLVGLVLLYVVYPKLNGLIFAGIMMLIFLAMAVLEFKSATKYHAEQGIVSD